MRFLHGRAWAMAAAVVMSASANAAADGVVARCSEDYEQSQRLSRAGRLREARARIVSCASPACPAVLRRDCTRWIEDVDERMPSVVVTALDANGSPIVDARLFVDDALIADRIDGRAVNVDPGEHRFRVVVKRRIVAETVVVVREGVKARALELSAGSGPTPAAGPPATAGEARPTPIPAPAPRERAPVSAIAYGAGALAAVATASFAWFGLSGREEQTNVLDACRGSCASDEVAAVRTKYLAADISLAVAVAAAGLTLWLVLARPTRTTSRGFGTVVF